VSQFLLLEMLVRIKTYILKVHQMLIIT